MEIITAINSQMSMHGQMEQLAKERFCIVRIVKATYYLDTDLAYFLTKMLKTSSMEVNTLNM